MLLVLSINDILTRIDDFVWGIPLMLIIILGGMLLTARLKLIQVWKLPKALKLIFFNEKDKNSEGEISSFAALCTALSATIGTGNIVGVATAICAGGPGALFWMVVAAFFGMATKYAEGFLAIKYRTISEKGEALGGPFYYIEKGIPTVFPKLKKVAVFLAKIFAIFGILVGLMGIGTFTQISGIATTVKNFFDANDNYLVKIPYIGEYSITIIITAVVLSGIVALVVIGGIKRISRVSEVIVPFMAVLYFLFAISLIIFNITKVPEAISIIVKSAFNPRAVTGGIVGSVIVSMQKGIARGIFSNEAGLGSAPIAAASAKTSNAARQGLVCMTGTFIDTIVICTLTGLTIVLTNAWQVKGLEGANVTLYAFNKGLPLPTTVTSLILMVCLVFFAFTTILGWNFYSEKCLEYLIGKRDKKIITSYRWIYVIAVFIGPFFTISAVWTLADIVNGLMAIPNMIALFILSGQVAKCTKDLLKKC